jgi:molybdopterin-containing oxidoreductase family iron-sulfur binding subunit
MDLDAIKKTLTSLRGRAYWRTLDRLAGSDAFQQQLHELYPSQAERFTDGVGRREFLKLMGASLALGGLTACTRQPTELIVPYARSPEALVPGQPIFFATSMAFGGAAMGLLVESHLGRPTKIEGNGEHPSSLGATDAFAQAAVLGLYDPDRSQVITRTGRIDTWANFLAALGEALGPQASKQGAGLRVLSETILSPTLAAQRERLLQKYPAAQWHCYEPINRDQARRGALMAFGTDVAVHPQLARADVIVALDADFLAWDKGRVALARAFASRRRTTEKMNRLYAIESAPSITGGSADHRLALRAADILEFARALAAAVGVDIQDARPSPHQRWITAIADDLKAHRGAGVVLAGDSQPPLVHALCHAMNQVLVNAGRSVTYTDPIELASEDQGEGMKTLCADMAAKRVDVLIVLGGNPVQTAPADLGFAQAMGNVPLRVHLGLYEDETSNLCHWHIAEQHFLESWSDARAHDGTLSCVQPLIAPLYEGRSPHELAAALVGDTSQTPYEIVRDHWRTYIPPADFEARWRRALHDGFVAGTALGARSVSVQKFDASAPAPASGLELCFRPDPTIWDGRFANNGWLQELPKPFTKLTWDNVALMSPATARRLGVAAEDIVELKLAGRHVRAPVFVSPYHADDSITVTVGYGRTQSGQVGTGAGFDAYALRTSAAPWIAGGLEVARTVARAALAATQEHHRMEGRDLARIETGGQGHDHDHGDEQGHGHPHQQEELSLYPPHPYEGRAWGMVIDLNTCIGCNACITACQSENNIPVVGKTQVAKGREMHWIRVDHYEEGEGEQRRTVHQPIPCMHCENAPCELVCPVGATVHSSEGLNDMVYNRCVGTRYCLNNCPYKVRRFNFLHYADYHTESLKPMRNPNVTVRSRGVMEKCSYCVQRISAARIRADREERPIRDGEIRTACEAACPAQAIVFGDINDPQSRVKKLRESPDHYALLAELNTRPRTTYLAKRLNPNPALEPAERPR